MTDAPRPSDLELQVLTVLWERGPLPVAAILEAVPDGKNRAYTTILSVLQVMEKKELVGHTTRGQANVYHPTVKRQQVMRPLMRQMLQNLFGGSAARAVQSLLDSSPVDADEMSQIRELLAAVEQKKKQPEPKNNGRKPRP
jgi:predicted transcriptional regulator